MKKLLFSIFLSIIVLLPFYSMQIVRAVDCTAPGVPVGCVPKDPEPGTGNCSFDKDSNKLCNPLPDKNVEDLIVRGLKYILGIIGTLAVVMIVIAGFRMVTSQGNEHAVGAAKKTITWAVIGLLVAFLAYSAVAIIQNALVNSK